LKEEVAAAAAKLAVRQAETAQERGGRKGKSQQFRPAGKPRRR
jgi:ribosome biogenesis GTPase